jgi:hypothetical protein
MSSPEIARRCPPGYRFLVQLVDEPDEQSARRTIARMFHELKLPHCKFVPGSLVNSCSHGWGPVEKTTGFMVFVPKGFRL